MDDGPDGRRETRHVTRSDIVGWFKTMTTNEYIRGVKTDGWSPFDGRVWQRTYHDRVIRDDGELERVRRYIAENPANWSTGPDRLLEGSS